MQLRGSLKKLKLYIRQDLNSFQANPYLSILPMVEIKWAQSALYFVKEASATDLSFPHAVLTNIFTNHCVGAK